MEFIFDRPENRGFAFDIDGITMSDIKWPDWTSANPSFKIEFDDTEIYEELLRRGIDVKPFTYEPRGGGEPHTVYQFKISFGHFGELYVYDSEFVEVREDNSDYLEKKRISNMNITVKPRPNKNDPSKMVVNLVKGECWLVVDRYERNKAAFLAGVNDNEIGEDEELPM